MSTAVQFYLSPDTKCAADVRKETLVDHAATHLGEYDAVCSFHVLEHVATPVLFVADIWFGACAREEGCSLRCRVGPRR